MSLVFDSALPCRRLPAPRRCQTVHTWPFNTALGLTCFFFSLPFLCFNLLFSFFFPSPPPFYTALYHAFLLFSVSDVGSVEGLAYHRGWDMLYWTSYTTSTITRHTVDQSRWGAVDRHTVVTMSGDDHPRAFVLDECQGSEFMHYNFNLLYTSSFFLTLRFHCTCSILCPCTITIKVFYSILFY